MYPSTITARPSRRMPSRARSKTYSRPPLSKHAVWAVFRYFGMLSSSARAPNPTNRPFASRIGNIRRPRKRSCRPFSPSTRRPAASSSASEKPRSRSCSRVASHDGGLYPRRNDSAVARSMPRRSTSPPAQAPPCFGGHKPLPLAVLLRAFAALPEGHASAGGEQPQRLHELDPFLTHDEGENIAAGTTGAEAVPALPLRRDDEGRRLLGVEGTVRSV